MTDEKPIRLRVVSVMTDPDGGRHESKTVHRGTLRAGEDGLEIAYEQVDEGVRARICLTWTADGVRMRRTGEMTGALHFQPGRKTAGLYGTAYGDIPVAVYTREVLTEEGENGGEMRLDCEGRRAYISDREIGLTAKEFEVLELLMKNPNKVYSRESLLQLVWGTDYPGDVRTVDVHIRRLREKIEQNPSEPKYVHTKWGVGYYFLNR